MDILFNQQLDQIRAVVKSKLFLEKVYLQIKYKFHRLFLK